MPVGQKQCDPCRQRGVCDAECSSQEREGGAPATDLSSFLQVPIMRRGREGIRL